MQVLPTTPTFLNLLVLSETYKKFVLNSLTLISYGTESMSETLLKKLNSIFPHVKLLQTYGTSETGISHTHSEANDSLWVKIDGEYRIEDGELLLKSQMVGYLNYDNDSDGWFRTGDLVEERDGYIRITGRKKDIINIGGQKVFPIEVESVLLNMQGIDDALVYGVKSPIMGEAVCAKVLVNKTIATTEIMKHCLSILDAYKVPTKIELVDKIEFGERFKRRRKNENN